MGFEPTVYRLRGGFFGFSCENLIAPLKGFVTITAWLHRRTITDLVIAISVTTYCASDGIRTHTGNIPAGLKVRCHSH